MGLLACFCLKPEAGQDADKDYQAPKSGARQRPPPAVGGPGPVVSEGVRHDCHHPHASSTCPEAKIGHTRDTSKQSSFYQASRTGWQGSPPAYATEEEQHSTQNGTAQHLDPQKHPVHAEHHVEVLTDVDPDEILQSFPSVEPESEDWADAEFMSCRTSFTSMQSFRSLDYPHVTALRHGSLTDGHKLDVVGPASGVDQVKPKAYAGAAPHLDGQHEAAKAYPPAPLITPAATVTIQQHVSPASAAAGKDKLQSALSATAAAPQPTPSIGGHASEPVTAEGDSQHATGVGVLQEALQLYKRQGGACGACKVLLRHCRVTGQPLSNLKDSIGQLSSKEDQATMRRLLHSSIAMQDMVGHIKDDSGWTVVRDDALKLMYRHEHGTTVHCFKARCILDCPVEHPMCLAREFDLAKTWNKYAIESLILHEWSMAELLCLAVLWMPWPFPNANLMIQAVGQDLLQEEGCFLATLESPDPVPEEGKMPDRLKGNAHVYVRPGSCMVYEPLPPASSGTDGVASQRAQCTIILNIDPNIKNVPEFVITFVLRVLAPFMYTMVVKLVERAFKDPHSAMAQRLQQRSELYNFVRSRTTKFLQKQQQQ